MSLLRPIHWYHFWTDLIWLEGPFKLTYTVCWNMAKVLQIFDLKNRKGTQSIINNDICLP